MKSKFNSLIKYLICVPLAALMFSSCSNKNNDSTQIDIVLDWTPNTNHTGLYVADKLGYFKEEGLNISIKQPPEDGATSIVASGKAQFGIDFQDSLSSAFALDQPIPVTTVAAILQHNTSGIISNKNNNITSPSDLENKKYSTWNGPIELSILKYIVENDGGDFNKINIVPNTITDVVMGLKSDIDAMWIYYNWDGIATELKGLETNFIEFKDIDPVFDYYTPVIIANNDFINNNPDITKKFLNAVSRGYKYSIDNPYQAAMILLKSVPELEANITIKSQEWVSKRYKDQNIPWGYIDNKRWNKFYNWLYEHSIIKNKIEDNFGFTNEYLPEK